MAIDFQRQRATFASFSGNSQSQDLAFVFPTNVIKAESAINGFSVGFTQSDHHLLRTIIDTNVISVSSNVVRVRVTLSLRDSSGFFDDPYDGFVDVLVIVDR